MTRIAKRLLCAVLLAAPSVALAYGVRVHEILPPRTLGLMRTPAGSVVGAEELAGIADADLIAFRSTVYARAARLADTVVRRAFLARYPDASRFDASAFKEFLMMNPSATVLGVDSFAAVYRAMPAGDRRQDGHPDYIAGARIRLATTLELGSIYPDLDRRNQDRLLRGPDGTPRLTPSGDSIPHDPASLNVGRLTGTASQGHAHFGLTRQPHSDDPSALKTEPWRFAIATGFPGPVLTFAPDNAQLYTDLAILAALGDRPGARALSALYAGNAMHYIADVGNAVHTIQVGIHPIFVDATVQAFLRRAFRLFGLLGTSPTRNAIGVDIITNLHNLSERLFEAEFVEALRLRDAGRADSIVPSMRPVLAALEAGDDSLARGLADTLRALRGLREVPDFGRAVAAVLVEANSRDGAEVFRVTRQIADSRVRVGRLVMDFDTVTDAGLWRYVRVHRGARVRTALDEFNEIHARGVARTSSALRAWWQEYLDAVGPAAPRRQQVADAVMARLVAERLAYLAAAEERRARWIASHGGWR